MRNTLTARQSMIVVGLVQGAVMLTLHEWFKVYVLTRTDLIWVAPVYVFAVFVPLTFNFLRSEFSAGNSLAGALASTAIIAVTAGWFGRSLGSAAEAFRNLSVFWEPDLLVFWLSSVVAWFVGLPFVQAALRDKNGRFPYPGLFEDAWRNTLLACNCIVFASFFWALLALWAGLFVVLHLGFFKDLFTSRYFFYPATAVAFGFAVSLEEKGAAALKTMRQYLLAFQTRLLPLAALIVVFFVGAIPASGLDAVWGTGRATPLLLCLQIAIIFLLNAAWQDGAQAAPFSAPVAWLVRVALIVLPILSALSIWSVSLRIEQYGWSIDRVWAAIAVGMTTLYGLGYASSALLRGWLPTLGKVNTGMALLLIFALLSVHTPLLDPRRVSADSQVSRLLAGITPVEKFDFDYLRFSLGRAGYEALTTLTELSGHPRADEIRAKAQAALTRTDRLATARIPIPEAREIAARLIVYPADGAIPPGLTEYLHARLVANKREQALAVLRTERPVPMIALDLGGDSQAEFVLAVAPYPVFSHQEGRWRQIGVIRFGGKAPIPEDVRPLLEAADFAAIPPRWRDLRLGDRRGMLISQEGDAAE